MPDRILHFCAAIAAIVGAWTATIFPVAAAAATESADYAQARWQVNMPEGVTSISREVYDLHMLIFWICVAIGVVVFGIMFVSMYLHRKSRGAQPANFTHSTRLEVLWTVVASLLLIAMAYPSTVTMIRLYDDRDAELDILITGYQWKWKYEYLGEDVQFFSSMLTPQDEIQNEAPKGEYYLLDVDEPLVIPTGKKIRFLITAADVLHSWWVPEFGVKRDAVPGFINEAWALVEREGVYRGQCTELCGKDHGFMPVVVHARPEDEYRDWLVQRQAMILRERALRDQIFSMDDMMKRGKSVYDKNCSSCHMPNGAGVPGIFPPLLQGSLAVGPMEKHMDSVINGVAGTAMAAFGAQLSEADIAAVISYERNAWGNNTGDLVQPIDIVKFQQDK